MRFSDEQVSDEPGVTVRVTSGTRQNDQFRQWGPHTEARMRDSFPCICTSISYHNDLVCIQAGGGLTDTPPLLIDKGKYS